MELVLRVLTSLVLPPLSHRHLDYCPHITTIHKQLQYCQPFFALLNVGSPYITQYTGEAIISPHFKAPEDTNRFEFDCADASVATSFIFDRTVPTKNEEENFNNSDTIELANSYDNICDNSAVGKMSINALNITEITKECCDEKFDVRVLMQQYEDIIPISHHFSFIWKVRFHKWFHCKDKRPTLVLLIYAMLCILLCCHPNADALTCIFEENSQFIRDFLYFVRTGPMLVGSLQNGDNSMCGNVVNSISPTMFNVHILSCYSVTAMIGRSDTGASALFNRFTWLQSELGIHKGQYMGLLPCLLRSCASYLSSSSQNLVEHSVDRDACIVDSPGVVMELRWVEAIFVLTMTLVSASAMFLPALTENGLVASLLTIISSNANICSGTGGNAENKQPVTSQPLYSRSFLRIYIESLAIQILDMSIANHTQTLTTFKELDGGTCVVERLIEELQGRLKMVDKIKGDVENGDIYSFTNASNSKAIAKLNELITDGSNYCEIMDFMTSGRYSDGYVMDVESKNQKEIGNDSLLSVPAASTTTQKADNVFCTSLNPSKQILIQSLLSLLSSYFFDGTQEATDRQQNALLRSPSFVLIFNMVFCNSSALGCEIVEPAHRLIGDLINNDANTPVILTFMISSGIIESILLSIRDRNIRYSTEGLLAAITLISTIALTVDGKALLFHCEPFTSLLQHFRAPYAVYPISPVLMTQEASHLFGSVLEEFIRYYPIYTELVMKCLVSECTIAVNCANMYSKKCVINDNNVNNDYSVEGYTQYFYCVTNYLQLLEPLLVHEECVTVFMKNGDNIKLLLDCFDASLGPSRCTLSLLACLNDPTPTSVGYCTLIATLKKCFVHISQCKPMDYITSIFLHLNSKMSAAHQQFNPNFDALCEKDMNNGEDGADNYNAETGYQEQCWDRLQ